MSLAGLNIQYHYILCYPYVEWGSPLFSKQIFETSLSIFKCLCLYVRSTYNLLLDFKVLKLDTVQNISILCIFLELRYFVTFVMVFA